MRSPALAAFEFDEVEAGRPRALRRQRVWPRRPARPAAGEKGVRFVQVNRGGFDTHTRNFPGHAGPRRSHGSGPGRPDRGSGRESALLTKTLVVMLSEFGRTPRINKDAGRDHHPAVFSCPVAGGGMKGRQAIGSSDEDGAMPRRPAGQGARPACHGLPRPGHRPEQGSHDALATADETGRQRQADQGTVCLSGGSGVRHTPRSRRAVLRSVRRRCATASNRSDRDRGKSSHVGGAVKKGPPGRRIIAFWPTSLRPPKLFNTAHTQQIPGLPAHRQATSLTQPVGHAPTTRAGWRNT